MLSLCGGNFDEDLNRSHCTFDFTYSDKCDCSELKNLQGIVAMGSASEVP